MIHVPLVPSSSSTGTFTSSSIASVASTTTKEPNEPNGTTVITMMVPSSVPSSTVSSSSVTASSSLPITVNDSGPSLRSPSSSTPSSSSSYSSSSSHTLTFPYYIVQEQALQVRRLPVGTDLRIVPPNWLYNGIPNTTLPSKVPEEDKEEIPSAVSTAPSRTTASPTTIRNIVPSVVDTSSSSSASYPSFPPEARTGIDGYANDDDLFHQFMLTKGPLMYDNNSRLIPLVDFLGQVDFLASAVAMKRLLRLMFIPYESISMVIHRIGPTLLLDGDPTNSSPSPFPSVHPTKNNFTAPHSSLRSNPSSSSSSSSFAWDTYHNERARELYSKFLYRSALPDNRYDTTIPTHTPILLTNETIEAKELDIPSDNRSIATVNVIRESGPSSSSSSVESSVLLLPDRSPFDKEEETVPEGSISGSTTVTHTPHNPSPQDTLTINNPIMNPSSALSTIPLFVPFPPVQVSLSNVEKYLYPPLPLLPSNKFSSSSSSSSSSVSTVSHDNSTPTGRKVSALIPSALELEAQSIENQRTTSTTTNTNGASKQPYRAHYHPPERKNSNPPLHFRHISLWQLADTNNPSSSSSSSSSPSCSLSSSTDTTRTATNSSSISMVLGSDLLTVRFVEDFSSLSSNRTNDVSMFESKDDYDQSSYGTSVSSPLSSLSSSLPPSTGPYTKRSPLKQSTTTKGVPSFSSTANKSSGKHSFTPSPSVSSSSSSTDRIVSLHLRDSTRPITATEALDLYLDARLAGVEALALCWHEQGIVKNYDIVSTEDILQKYTVPTSSNSSTGIPALNPLTVEANAFTLLQFLKESCSKDGTYWLYRHEGDTTLRLFDLTNNHHYHYNHPNTGNYHHPYTNTSGTNNPTPTSRGTSPSKKNGGTERFSTEQYASKGTRTPGTLRPLSNRKRSPTIADIPIEELHLDDSQTSINNENHVSLSNVNSNDNNNRNHNNCRSNSVPHACALNNTDHCLNSSTTPTSTASEDRNVSNLSSSTTVSSSNSIASSPKFRPLSSSSFPSFPTSEDSATLPVIHNAWRINLITTCLAYAKQVQQRAQDISKKFSIHSSSLSSILHSEEKESEFTVNDSSLTLFEPQDEPTAIRHCLHLRLLRRRLLLECGELLSLVQEEYNTTNLSTINNENEQFTVAEIESLSIALHVQLSEACGDVAEILQSPNTINSSINDDTSKNNDGLNTVGRKMIETTKTEDIGKMKTHKVATNEPGTKTSSKDNSKKNTKGDSFTPESVTNSTMAIPNPSRSSASSSIVVDGTNGSNEKMHTIMAWNESAKHLVISLRLLQLLQYQYRSNSGIPTTSASSTTVSVTETVSNLRKESIDLYIRLCTIASHIITLLLGTNDNTVSITVPPSSRSSSTIESTDIDLSLAIIEDILKLGLSTSKEFSWESSGTLIHHSSLPDLTKDPSLVPEYEELLLFQHPSVLIMVTGMLGNIFTAWYQLLQRLSVSSSTKTTDSSVPLSSLQQWSTALQPFPYLRCLLPYLHQLTTTQASIHSFSSVIPATSSANTTTCSSSPPPFPSHNGLISITEYEKLSVSFMDIINECKEKQQEKAQERVRSKSANKPSTVSSSSTVPSIPSIHVLHTGLLCYEAMYTIYARHTTTTSTTQPINERNDNNFTIWTIIYLRQLGSLLVMVGRIHNESCMNYPAAVTCFSRAVDIFSLVNDDSNEFLARINTAHTLRQLASFTTNLIVPKDPSVSSVSSSSPSIMNNNERSLTDSPWTWIDTAVRTVKQYTDKYMDNNNGTNDTFTQDTIFTSFQPNTSSVSSPLSNEIFSLFQKAIQITIEPLDRLQNTTTNVLPASSAPPINTILIRLCESIGQTALVYAITLSKHSTLRRIGTFPSTITLDRVLKNTEEPLLDDACVRLFHLAWLSYSLCYRLSTVSSLPSSSSSSSLPFFSSSLTTEAVTKYSKQLAAIYYQCGQHYERILHHYITFSSSSHASSMPSHRIHSSAWIVYYYHQSLRLYYQSLVSYGRLPYRSTDQFMGLYPLLDYGRLLHYWSVTTITMENSTYLLFDLEPTNVTYPTVSIVNSTGTSTDGTVISSNNSFCIDNRFELLKYSLLCIIHHGRELIHQVTKAYNLVTKDIDKDTVRSTIITGSDTREGAVLSSSPSASSTIEPGSILQFSPDTIQAIQDLPYEIIQEITWILRDCLVYLRKQGVPTTHVSNSTVDTTLGSTSPASASATTTTTTTAAMLKRFTEIYSQGLKLASKRQKEQTVSCLDVENYLRDLIERVI